MKKAIRLFALLLAMALCFSGCAELIDRYAGYMDYIRDDNGEVLEAVAYYRPNVQIFEDGLQDCMQLVENGAKVDEIVECVQDISWEYDDFYTNHNLAYIHFCCDMTDTHWQTEYQFCVEASVEVETCMEELFQFLAQSSYKQALEENEYFGQDFFESYTGESVWDETYTNLYTREYTLLQQYYDVTSGNSSDESIFSETNGYDLELAQILVELIKVRQQMAQQIGIESYADMSYAFTYGRSYKPSDAKEYLVSVAENMAALYAVAYDMPLWNYGYNSCTEEQTYSFVENTASEMGGAVKEAFDLMEKYTLYDIGYGKNKYDGCFNTYLYTYGVPFIYMNPMQAQMDKLSFAHEFGHYCNDYICEGSYVGTDVAEVQSQAMEYMALCCNEDPELERYKLADSLDVYVIQSAYALFELYAYELPEEQLTAENLKNLFENVCAQFGMDGLSGWDFVSVDHFFTDPMYVISYVISNDLAMQLYSLENQTPGAGIAVYLKCLESQEQDIMAFVKAYELEDPFCQERISRVKQLFEEKLAITS